MPGLLRLLRDIQWGGGKHSEGRVDAHEPSSPTSRLGARIRHASRRGRRHWSAQAPGESIASAEAVQLAGARPSDRDERGAIRLPDSPHVGVGNTGGGWKARAAKTGPCRRDLMEHDPPPGSTTHRRPAATQRAARRPTQSGRRSHGRKPTRRER